MDDALAYEVLEGNPEPLLFHPLVDFGQLPEPNIINAF
jgi:hypothetical protein